MGELSIIEPAELLPASSSLSLDLPASTSFEDWTRVGRELAAREKVLNWWIGDWWAFGEHKWGERSKLAAEGVFGLKFQTLRNFGSVCRSIETSRRRDTLDWSHHVEIAALSPEAGDRLLDQAEQEKTQTGKPMSVAELRAAARVIQGRTVSEVLTARGDDPDHYEVLTIARAWNRAQTHNRETFRELLEEAGLQDIDP